MTNNRESFRYRTLRKAKIQLGGGGAIDCVVYDISTKGAGLELAKPAKIPKEFILFIREQNARFHCRVVWQAGNRISVQYL